MGALSFTSGIVTGAGSGIGRAVSIGLAKEGATLRLLDIDFKGASETGALCAKVAEGEIHAHEADVTDYSSLEEPFRKIEFFGGPNFVVHCAGVRGGYLFHTMPEEEWDRVLDTNLKGAYNVAKITLETMRRTTEPGSLVIVSSMTGLVSNGEGFHCAHYAASKAGINGLVKALAVEYAPYKIRVNAVCPGPVITPMTEAFKAANPDLYRKFMKRIPLGPGKPEDIVGPVVLLASKAGRWITGSLLMVDGGYTAQ